MKLSNRVSAVLGCVCLVYAILAKAFHLPESNFAASMAGIFFIFSLIRWIASLSTDKNKTQHKPN